MSALVIGILGITIAAFVIGSQFAFYFSARKKQFSRIVLACGIIGLLLSIEGLVSHFPSVDNSVLVAMGSPLYSHVH